ncbi:MAG: biopolymer transporter ExbD [Polyangia bacterium]
MAGGAAYTDEGGDSIIADINVTPLVDIVLVLLIVFMITVPKLVSTPSIKVNLPKAATADPDTPKTTLSITLQRTDAGFDLYVNGEKTDEGKLRAMVPPMVAKNKELQAVISADKGIAYGDVVHIVDVVKQLNVTKFALNTDPT